MDEDDDFDSLNRMWMRMTISFY